MRFEEVGPRGSRVGTFIDVPLVGPLSMTLRMTLREMDAVVGDGELARVAALAQPPTQDWASAEYEPRLRTIRVDPDSSRPALDLLHEIGHVLYIDEVYPALQRVGPLLLADYHSALYDTKLCRFLSQERACLRDIAPVVKSLDYLMSEEELFARSFSLFIAVRSKWPVLRKELDRRETIDTTALLPNMWDDDDYLKVDCELVRLFRRLGWIR